MNAAAAHSTADSPVAARLAGVEARRILDSARDGRVAATFERTLYLRFGEDWVCLGGPALPPGPLSLACDGFTAENWARIARQGTTVRSDGNALSFQGGDVIAFSGAITWQPAPMPLPGAARLREGLSLLSAHLPPTVEREGLARFLQSTTPGTKESLVVRAAAPAIEALAEWLAGRSEQGLPLWAVEKLLGLGPGLTPSGDDFLAGVLLALHHLARHREAEPLAQAIHARAQLATVEVSAAYLRCAARGLAAEPLHRAFAACATADDEAIRAALDSFDGLGHSSPWDTLAGYAVAAGACIRYPSTTS